MFSAYLGDKGYVGTLSDKLAAASAAQDLFNGDSNNPADLSWTTGRRRFWWHNNDPAGMSVNADGTGGMPALTDPVGALITGASVSSYNLELAGTAGTRQVDGIRLPYNGLYLTNLPGGAGNSSTTGLTFGFRGYISAAGGSGNFGVIGHDVSPPINIMYVSGGGLASLTTDGVTNTQVGSLDFSAIHSYVAYVEPDGGGTLNGAFYIDGVQVDTSSAMNGFAWDRDLMYMLIAGGARKFTIQSRFMGEQAFTSEDDIALIFRFLENGA
jgi:hypothetical protein